MSTLIGNALLTPAGDPLGPWHMTTGSRGCFHLLGSLTNSFALASLLLSPCLQISPHIPCSSPLNLQLFCWVMCILCARVLQLVAQRRDKMFSALCKRKIKKNKSVIINSCLALRQLFTRCLEPAPCDSVLTFCLTLLPLIYDLYGIYLPGPEGTDRP